MITPVQIFSVNKPLNTNNRNRNMIIPVFGTHSDGWQGAGSISADNYDRLSYISSAYKEVYTELDKKTPLGIENIEKVFCNANNLGNVTLYKGIFFRNINKNHDCISLKIPQLKKLNNYTKLVLYDKDKNIKEAFLIYSDRYVVKNYNKEEPNKIPEKCEFYTSKELEAFSIDKKLDKLLTEIDPLVLSLRKTVKARENMDLRPKEAFLPESYSTRIKKMAEIDEALCAFYATVSNKRATKLRTAFDTYLPANTAHSYTFKDLGDEDLKINYSQLNNPQHGRMSRIMVYDRQNQLINGYLIKDDKIVANFNPKNFAFIPPKLVFTDEKHFEENNYSKDFEKYLTLISEEMVKFYSHVTRPEVEKAVGIFNGAEHENIIQIKNLYKSIETAFDDCNSKEVFEIKNSYQDLEQIAGKRGFTFVNAEDNSKITIYEMKTRQHPDLLKITYTSPQGEEKVYMIADGEKLVSNYNPQYTVIPEKLLFFNEDEIEEQGISEYLKMASERLGMFTEHVNVSVSSLNDKKAVLKQRREELRQRKEEAAQKRELRAQGLLPKAARGPRIRTVKVLSEEQIKERNTKRFNKFSKQCVEDFKQAINSAPDNPDMFSAVLNEIKTKVLDFIENMQAGS